VHLEEDRASQIVFARSEDPFTASELNLMRGMARVLALALSTLRHVKVERELREKSDRQAEQLAERHRLFERLTRIQRSISHQAPLEDVFDAITSGASELMGESDAIVGLRLIDSEDPGWMEMASLAGVDVPDSRRLQRAPVGEGAGGRAITEKRLVIVEGSDASHTALPLFAGRVHAAMAAPVHERGEVVGSLVFASRRVGRTFTQSEQETLLAFAEHTSLALSDAKSLHALRQSFHLSLSDITGKARRDKEVLEEQLRRTQKIDAIGRLAGGVAHDFNNLLMVIQASAEFARQDLIDLGGDPQDINEILNATERATRLVRQLLTFSRKEVTRPKVVDVNELVGEMTQLLRRTLGESVSLNVQLADQSCATEIDPSHLEQVVMNLSINARDAMSGVGKLAIKTSIRTRDVEPRTATAGRSEYVCLEVSDTGCGMAPDVQERAFEPFFTTKARGEGTGLGLSTVYGIVADAGGHIDVASADGEGTTFTILLPLSHAEQTVELVAPPTDPARGHAPHTTVLVVEDEDTVRELIERILHRNRYVVLSTSSGGEALDVLRTQGDDVDVVLTDVVMPVMTGIELMHEMRERDLPHPVIFMSGYTDDSFADPSLMERAAGFLPKPFNEESVLDAIEAASNRSDDDFVVPIPDRV
jgi:signal transduction histidine kinase/ActR/RegA family two-component response regulator